MKPEELKELDELRELVDSLDCKALSLPENKATIDRLRWLHEHFFNEVIKKNQTKVQR